MQIISRVWQWWHERANRMVDPRPMAVSRICIMLCLLFDLLTAAKEGLVFALFRTFAEGGINRLHSKTALWITEISPEYGGPVAWGICIVSALLVMLGVATRPLLAVLLVAYSQLGHLYNPGDRGIDQMLRLCLIILLCSGCHLRFSVLPRKTIPTHCYQWPAQLITLAVVLMYMQAGFHKIGSNASWLLGGDNSSLYRIVSNPMASKLDAVDAAQWMWLWNLGGKVTVLFESAAFVLLTRYAIYWASLGIFMHLGIAYFMHLGMFSWGMLALYPIILYPWTIRLLDYLAEYPWLSGLGAFREDS